MTRLINLSVAKRHKEDPCERSSFLYILIDLHGFEKEKESVESTGFRAFYYDVFFFFVELLVVCLLYTSPSPRDRG